MTDTTTIRVNHDGTITDLTPAPLPLSRRQRRAVAAWLVRTGLIFADSNTVDTVITQLRRAQPVPSP